MKRKIACCPIHALLGSMICFVLLAGCGSARPDEVEVTITVSVTSSSVAQSRLTTSEITASPQITAETESLVATDPVPTDSFTGFPLPQQDPRLRSA